MTKPNSTTSRDIKTAVDLVFAESPSVRLLYNSLCVDSIAATSSWWHRDALQTELCKVFNFLFDDGFTSSVL